MLTAAVAKNLAGPADTVAGVTSSLLAATVLQAVSMAFAVA